MTLHPLFEKTRTAKLPPEKTKEQILWLLEVKALPAEAGSHEEILGHRWCFPQSHQWQGRILQGTGKLT